LIESIGEDHASEICGVEEEAPSVAKYHNGNVLSRKEEPERGCADHVAAVV
jgi:hypothetical protein